MPIYYPCPSPSPSPSLLTTTDRHTKNKPKLTHSHISRNRGINRIKSSDHLRQSYGAPPQGVSTERDTYSTDIAVDDMQHQNKKIKKKSKNKKNVKVRYLQLIKCITCAVLCCTVLRLKRTYLRLHTNVSYQTNLIYQSSSTPILPLH